jgi:hypothetical protein
MWWSASSKALWQDTRSFLLEQLAAKRELATIAA